MALRLLPDPGHLGALDAGRAARLLEERAALLARRGAAPAVARAAPVLLVALGAETFGLPLDRVAAVLPAGPTAALPGTGPAVLGLGARGGRPHAVLDLAVLLGLAAGAAAGAHDVLLRPLPAGGRLALRVDRALEALAPVPLPPGRAPPGGPAAFHAAHPGGGGPLAVLDLDRLLRFPRIPTEPGA